MIRNSSWKGNIPREQQRSPKPVSGSGFFETQDRRCQGDWQGSRESDLLPGRTNCSTSHLQRTQGGVAVFLSFVLRPLRFSVLNSIKHVEWSSFSIKRTWLKDGNSYDRPPKSSSSQSPAYSTSCGAIVEKLRTGYGGCGCGDPYISKC